MKSFWFSLIKCGFCCIGLLFAGCATPFHSKQKGPSPEDTMIRREVVIPVEAPAEPARALSTPRRPEPEPEEEVIIIEEPEEVIIEVQPAGATYKVKKGDNLSWIARKFHVRLDELMRVNNLTKDSKLQIGQSLILPGVSQETVDALSVGESKYKVKRGDCLSLIARRHGLSIEELRAANNLKTDRIVAGKVIIIPEKGRYVGTSAKATQPGKTAVKETLDIDANGYYTLKKGDTLGKIASQTELSAREIQDLNHINDPKTIQAGQRILVRNPEAKLSAESSAKGGVGGRVSVPEKVEVVQPVQQKDLHGFISDSDFFDSVDDIPILQVEA